MTAQPRLFLGNVMHHRLRPAVNAFVYPVFYIQLPLRDLAAANCLFFSIDRSNLFSFQQKDHGPRDGSPLLPWITARLRERGLPDDGEIILQTFPRLFGYVFNPVSFWFCHDREGALRAVLAEVRNTFGDHHNYLVAHADQRPITAADTLTARKLFHVSPFFPVAGEYRFRFDLDPQRRRVMLDYWLDGERVLATALQGAPQTLDVAAARRALLRQPLLTLAVVWRIHWQAVQLWLKRAVFHSRPQPPLQETTR